MANRTLTMLLGYDPISRLDDGSPSNVDRRTALASPINDLGVRDNLQPTTPMGLIGGTLTQVRTGLLLWCKVPSDWKVVATTGNEMYLGKSYFIILWFCFSKNQLRIHYLGPKN